MAVDANPTMPQAVRNLGTVMWSLFKATRALSDPNRAIDLASKAVVTLTQKNNAYAPAEFLHSLGYFLLARFEETKTTYDIVQAIVAILAAMDSASQTSLTCAKSRNILEDAYMARFMQTNSFSHLNQAVQLAHQSVKLIPSNSPIRALLQMLMPSLRITSLVSISTIPTRSLFKSQ